MLCLYHFMCSCSLKFCVFLSGDDTGSPPKIAFDCVGGDIGSLVGRVMPKGESFSHCSDCVGGDFGSLWSCQSLFGLC